MAAREETEQTLRFCRLKTWIGRLIGKTAKYEKIKTLDELITSLRTGEDLCKIANHFRPNSIPKIHEEPTLYFQKLENVTFFIEALKPIEVFSASEFMKGTDNTKLLNRLFWLMKSLEATSKLERKTNIQNNAASARHHDGFTQTLHGNFSTFQLQPPSTLSVANPRPPLDQKDGRTMITMSAINLQTNPLDEEARVTPESMLNTAAGKIARWIYLLSHDESYLFVHSSAALFAKISSGESLCKIAQFVENDCLAKQGMTKSIADSNVAERFQFFSFWCKNDLGFSQGNLISDLDIKKTNIRKILIFLVNLSQKLYETRRTTIAPVKHEFTEIQSEIVTKEDQHLIAQINKHLQNLNPPLAITNLTTDLCTSVILIKLIEVLTGAKPTRVYHDPAVLPNQKSFNASILFMFLSQNIDPDKKIKCTQADVVKPNKPAIANLIKFIFKELDVEFIIRKEVDKIAEIENEDDSASTQSSKSFEVTKTDTGNKLKAHPLTPIYQYAHSETKSPSPLLFEENEKKELDQTSQTSKRPKSPTIQKITNLDALSEGCRRPSSDFSSDNSIQQPELSITNIESYYDTVTNEMNETSSKRTERKLLRTNRSFLFTGLSSSPKSAEESISTVSSGQKNSMPQKKSVENTASSPSSFSLTEVFDASNPPSFDSVLRVPWLLLRYLRFLEDAHAEENLLFWAEASAFRLHESSKEDMFLDALRIFNQYISSSSSLQCNLSAEIVETIKFALDEAKTEIDAEKKNEKIKPPEPRKFSKKVSISEEITNTSERRRSKNKNTLSARDRIVSEDDLCDLKHPPLVSSYSLSYIHQHRKALSSSLFEEAKNEIEFLMRLQLYTKFIKEPNNYTTHNHSVDEKERSFCSLPVTAAWSSLEGLTRRKEQTKKQTTEASRVQTNTDASQRKDVPALASPISLSPLSKSPIFSSTSPPPLVLDKKKTNFRSDPIAQTIPQNKRKLLKAQTSIRLKVCKSLFQNEVIFVRSIKSLIDLLILNIQREEIKGKPVLSQKDFDSIFGNVMEIWTVHYDLCGKYEAKINQFDEMTTMSDLMVKPLENFEIYSTYVSNYLNAIRTLQVCCSTNPIFRGMVKFFNNSDHLKPQPGTVLDYLSLPVQRFSSYIVTIKNLLKVTLRVHPDYMLLMKASDEFRAAVHSLSHILDEDSAEQTRRVLSIALSLTGDGGNVLAIPGRRLVREGMVANMTMRDESSKDEKRPKKIKHKLPMVFLFNDLIVACSALSKHSDPHSPYTVLGKMQISVSTEMNVVSPLKMRIIDRSSLASHSHIRPRTWVLVFGRDDVHVEWQTDLALLLLEKENEQERIAKTADTISRDGSFPQLSPSSDLETQEIQDVVLPPPLIEASEQKVETRERRRSRKSSVKKDGCHRKHKNSEDKAKKKEETNEKSTDEKKNEENKEGTKKKRSKSRNS